MAASALYAVPVPSALVFHPVNVYPVRVNWLADAVVVVVPGLAVLFRYLPPVAPLPTYSMALSPLPIVLEIGVFEAVPDSSLTVLPALVTSVV